MKSGRPQVVSRYSTAQNGPEKNTKGRVSRGAGIEGRATRVIQSGHRAVFMCRRTTFAWIMSRSRSRYVAGQPYVGATLAMYPPPGEKNHGQLHRLGCERGQDRAVQPEKFSVWSGALTTAGGLACYGTLEGYLKCVDAKTSTKELFKFKTPSGIIGQRLQLSAQRQTVHRRLFGYWRLGRHRSRGWPGEGCDGLGAVGGYKELANYTDLGGSLTVFRAAAEINQSGTSRVHRRRPGRRRDAFL